MLAALFVILESAPAKAQLQGCVWVWAWPVCWGTCQFDMHKTTHYYICCFPVGVKPILS